MKKSLISVLLVCTLTFMTLLSGCGGGNKDSKQSGKDGINRIELTGDAAEMAELFGQDYVLERAKWEKENNPYNIPENPPFRKFRIKRSVCRLSHLRSH